MPKLKSHRGAAKRFRRISSSVKKKFKFRRANRNHILTKKAPGRMLRLRPQAVVKKCDSNAIDRLLNGS